MGSTHLILAILCGIILLVTTLHGFAGLHGGGDGELGFVAPPRNITPPPPPPKNIASAETFVPFPGPPVVPQSRSEAKNPPKPPVMFTKIRSQHSVLDWSVYPEDLPYLLKSMKEKINASFEQEIKSWSEVNADPEKNPILYRTGHFRFRLSPAERKKIRQYLLDGGFILFNTGLGSMPFYRSAVEELTAIFPEVPLQRLTEDHPIYHSYYDIDRVNLHQGAREAGYRGYAPAFDGITINCRTVAVISRFGLSAGWAGKDEPQYQIYDSESAVKLGVNVMAYATAQRAWAKQAVNSVQFVDKDETLTGKMYIGQARYAGEWKTRDKALSMLMHQFNRETDIPVKYGHKTIALDSPAIFETPLLYITGHENFELNAKEMRALRQYLLNGGTLFAEACCGRRGFDAAFRQTLRKVLPERPLKEIPKNHLILNYPTPIKRVGVTPALAAKLGGAQATRPILHGVDIDGHLAVIYSPYGLAGGWELTPNPYSHSYDQSGAYALGQNILLYAITQ
jgi:hypothetical protein